MSEMITRYHIEMLRTGRMRNLEGRVKVKGTYYNSCDIGL